jgi:hypothetical protein
MAYGLVVCWQRQPGYVELMFQADLIGTAVDFRAAAELAGELTRRHGPVSSGHPSTMGRQSACL